MPIYMVFTWFWVFFIPLIITNCIVLARIEAFAAKNRPAPAAADGAMMGVGMLWTLALIGALRELIGGGTLFSGIDLVIPGAAPLQLLPADYPGLLTCRAATRCLYRAWLHDCHQELDRCAQCCTPPEPGDTIEHRRLPLSD